MLLGVYDMIEENTFTGSASISTVEKIYQRRKHLFGLIIYDRVSYGTEFWT